MKEQRNISDIEEKYRKNENSIDRSYFSSVGIVITQRCNIHCRHCICDCNEKSDSELSRSDISGIIKQAALIRQIKSVVFTGGEPFLVSDKLTHGVSLCSECGIETAVMTNGFWAADVEEAIRRLGKLSGLTAICVSTDIFHQEFVPIQRIRNIILACNELRIKCAIAISYLNDPVSEIKAITDQLDGLDDMYEVQTQPVAPFGRAESEIDSGSLYKYDASGKPCLSADGPVIEANGNVMACCGGITSHNGNGVLRLGNIYEHELSEIVDKANSNPIVHILRLRGPSGLLHLIKKQSLAEGCTIPVESTEFPELCTLCKYIITNQEYIGLLDRALCNPRIIRDIAIARLAELGETDMLVKKQTAKVGDKNYANT